MSGETQKQESAWTTDTLKENLENEICSVRKQIGESDRRYEQRFDGQEKATNVALQSAKEAVTKAEAATEKRFESVNEFRAALADQSNTLLTRNEYDTNHKAIIDKVDDVTRRVAAIENSSKGSQLAIGKIYAAIAAVGAILAIIMLLANGVFK